MSLKLKEEADVTFIPNPPSNDHGIKKSPSTNVTSTTNEFPVGDLDLLSLVNSVRLNRDPAPEPIDRKPSPPHTLEQELGVIQETLNYYRLRVEQEEMSDREIDDLTQNLSLDQVNELMNDSMLDSSDVSSGGLTTKLAISSLAEIDIRVCYSPKQDKDGELPQIEELKPGQLYRCHDCLCDLKSELSRDEHVNIHLGRSFTCLLCDAELYSEVSAYVHVKLAHLPKDWCCTECDFRSHFCAYLETHMNQIHKRPLSFACTTCGRKFTERHHMRWHVSEKHKDVTPFYTKNPATCSYCMLGFQTKLQLRDHIESYHGDTSFNKQIQTVYVCPLLKCQVVSKTANRLRVHVEVTHCNGHRGPYICDICGKAFKDYRDRASHMVTHSERRNFGCMHPGCGKMFKLKKHLMVHMRIHNDERPLACDHCQFRCRQRNSMNWHMKTKHPDEWEREREEKRRKQLAKRCNGVGGEGSAKDLLGFDKLVSGNKINLKSEENLKALLNAVNTLQSSLDERVSRLGDGKDKENFEGERRGRPPGSGVGANNGADGNESWQDFNSNKSDQTFNSNKHGLYDSGNDEFSRLGYESMNTRLPRKVPKLSNPPLNLLKSSSSSSTKIDTPDRVRKIEVSNFGMSGGSSSCSRLGNNERGSRQPVDDRSDEDWSLDRLFRKLASGQENTTRSESHQFPLKKEPGTEKENNVINSILLDSDSADGPENNQSALDAAVAIYKSHQAQLKQAMYDDEKEACYPVNVKCEPPDSFPTRNFPRSSIENMLSNESSFANDARSQNNTSNSLNTGTDNEINNYSSTESRANTSQISDSSNTNPERPCREAPINTSNETDVFTEQSNQNTPSNIQVNEANVNKQLDLAQASNSQDKQTLADTKPAGQEEALPGDNTFKHPIDYERHISSFVNKAKESSTSLNDISDRELASAVRLDSDLRKFRVVWDQETDQPIFSTTNSSEAEHMCLFCNEYVYGERGKMAHINWHLGKMYLCNICGVKLYYEEDIMVHIDNIHGYQGLSTGLFNRG